MQFQTFSNKIRYRYRRLLTRLWYAPQLQACGNNSVVYRPLLMEGLRYLSLGSNVIIFGNNRIEIFGGYGEAKFTPELSIGDYSQIHQNCHITCAGKITIGSNVVVVAGVTITDINHPYEDIYRPINQQELEVGSVSIGDQTYIYNNAVILPNTHIGKHCVIGANSLVGGVIPDYSVVVGSPGKIIRQFSQETGKWISVK